MRHWQHGVGLALALALALALIAAVVGGELPRQTYHCSLRALGSGSNASVELNLSCEGPLPRLSVGRFPGMPELRLAGDLAAAAANTSGCLRKRKPELVLTVNNNTRTVLALLHICAAEAELVLSLEVDGVRWLHEGKQLPPTAIEPEPSVVTSVLAVSGGVRAAVINATLRNNTLSSVLVAAGNSSLELEQLEADRNRGDIGAVVLAGDNAHVSLRNSWLGAGLARLGGCLAAIGAARVTLHNSTLSDCVATDSGGGLMAADRAHVSIKAGSSVQSCRALQGGGGGVLLLGSSSLIFQGSRLFNDSARLGGGLLARQKSIATLHNATVLNCSAAANGGGAALIQKAYLASHASRWSNCSAGDDGGALSSAASLELLADSSCEVVPGMTRAPRLVFNASIADYNQAGKHGGALHVNETSSASIAHAVLAHNKAKHGGALVVVHSAEVHVLDSQIIKNTADEHGAGLVAWDAAMVGVKDANITFNRAEGPRSHGGGVAAWTTAIVTLQNSNISSNSASMHGGGVAAWDKAAVLLDNCTLSRCASNDSGGGARVHGSASFTAQSTEISHNRAARNGGAVDISGPACRAFILQGSVVAHNVALHGVGGGVAANVTCAAGPSDGAPELLVDGGSRFSDNGASNGSAVYATARLRLRLPPGGSNLSINDSAVVWGRARRRGQFLSPATGTYEDCPAFSYSLEGTNHTKCSDCPNGAECRGGVIVVSRRRFWHSSGAQSFGGTCKLDDFMRCPNPLACQHEEQELADKHPHRPAANNASSSNSNTSTAWAEYTQAQCQAGHTGPLCAVCNAPCWGQADTFVCRPCAVTPSGDLDTPRILVRWAGLSLAWLAGIGGMVFTSVHAQHAARRSAAAQLPAKAGTAAAAAGGAHRLPPSSAAEPVAVAKALFVWLNYLCGFVARLHVDWPPVISGLFGSLSSAFRAATSSASSVDCLLAYGGALRPHKAALKALVTIVSPFVIYAALCVLQALWWLMRARLATSRWAAAACGRPWLASSAVGRWWARSRSAAEQQSLRAYQARLWVVTALATAFAWEPSLARVAFSLFQCVDVCDRSLFALDMTMACPLTGGVPTAAGALALAVGAAALVLTAALPVFVAARLLSGAAHGRLDDPTFRAHFGLLYADYNVAVSPAAAQHGTPRVRWLKLAKARIRLAWDVVLHMQTIALAAVAVFGVASAFLQALCLALVFGAHLVLVLTVRPFALPSAQRLQAGLSGVLCVSCLFALAFAMPVDTLDERTRTVVQRSQAVFGVLLLASNALFLATALGLLGAHGVRWLRRALRARRRAPPPGRAAASAYSLHAASDSRPAAGAPAEQLSSAALKTSKALGAEVP